MTCNGVGLATKWGLQRQMVYAMTCYPPKVDTPDSFITFKHDLPHFFKALMVGRLCVSWRWVRRRRRVAVTMWCLIRPGSRCTCAGNTRRSFHCSGNLADASERMMALIAASADKGKVNLFRRWALMRIGTSTTILRSRT